MQTALPNQKEPIALLTCESVVTMEANRDSITVEFDDDGPLGADTYEVILTFDP